MRYYGIAFAVALSLGLTAETKADPGICTVMDPRCTMVASRAQINWPSYRHGYQAPRSGNYYLSNKLKPRRVR
jgi:hypothetical protein